MYFGVDEISLIFILFQNYSEKMFWIMYFWEIDMNWQSWKARHSPTYYSHESALQPPTTAFLIKIVEIWVNSNGFL